ncbi:MAG: serine hydrolase domain-containing protein [Sedimentisphaerales bacterium]
MKNCLIPFVSIGCIIGVMTIVTGDDSGSVSAQIQEQTPIKTSIISENQENTTGEAAADSNREHEKIKTLSGNEITKSEMDEFLKIQMDSMDIKGLSIAIINDAKVVYHLTRGIADINSSETVNGQTLFQAASLSKPIFAYFVMKIVEQGVLDLDTPLYKYLPYPDIEYDQRYKLITARMVLSHTSGFPNWRPNYKGKLDIKFTPGTKYLYSGEGYMYLAKVIAHLTNRDLSNLDSLFQQQVCEPLNLKHTYFGMNDYVAKHLAKGHIGDKIAYDKDFDIINFNSAGGLYTEAIDYANFLIAIMNEKGLKKTSFDEMLKEYVQMPDDDNAKRFMGQTGYGLGFGMKSSIYGITYLHGGNNWGFTSGFMMNKEKKFGFVFFTNSEQFNNGRLSNLYQKLEAFLTDRSDSPAYFIDFEGMK